MFLDIMIGKSESFHCSSYDFCKMDSPFASSATIPVHISSLIMQVFFLQETSVLMCLKYSA